MTYQTACVEAFKAEIAPFVGTAPTAHNVVAANNIINNFTGRLQLGDLTLSQQDALEILRDAYKELTA